MAHTLVLNESLTLDGRRTGHDYNGRTVEQRLENDASRLERVIATLNQHGDDDEDEEDEDEPVVNSNLTKVWDTAGSPRIIDLDQIMHAYLLNDAVHVVLPGQPSIAIPRSEALRVGLDLADANPRTPKSSDQTYPASKPTHNEPLELPQMHYHDSTRTKTRLVANILETPCCNGNDEVLVPPTLVFAHEELPATPQFASYGHDDTGDVLPCPGY